MAVRIENFCCGNHLCRNKWGFGEDGNRTAVRIAARRSVDEDTTDGPVRQVPTAVHQPEEPPVPPRSYDPHATALQHVHDWNPTRGFSHGEA